MRQLMLCSLLGLVAGSEAQPSLETRLAEPVTVASEVLLGAHGQDPRVRTRWTQALSHADAATRAVVARVVQAAGAIELAPAVAAQLRVEQDLAAAVEQAESLTAMTRRFDSDARAACVRHGGPVAASVTLALARVSPVQLVAELGTLRAFGPDVDLAVVEVLRDWNEQAAPQAPHLQLALIRAGDPVAWRILLKASLASGNSLAAGWVVTGLASGDDEVTSLLLAYLVELDAKQLTQLRDMPTIVVAVDAIVASVSQRSPSTQLLATLLCRRLGRPATGVDVIAVASDMPAESLPRRMGISQLSGLTGAEQATLSATWNTPRTTNAASQRNTGDRKVGPDFIGGLPGSVLHEVLKATRCHRRGAFATAFVRYGPEGRPTSVTTGDGLGKCQPVIGALVALTRDNTPGRSTPVMVPLDDNAPDGFARRSVRLPRYAPAAWSAPHQASAVPELVKVVHPQYDYVALRQKFQGTVGFEIVVDERGEVSAMRLTRSAYEGFNSSAAAALLQWRFSPPVANGEPVPLRVPAEISFALP